MEDRHASISPAYRESCVTGHDVRLDGIRGLAVLLVLFHHSLQNLPIRNVAERAVYHLAGICWVGVDLFFVLSGFLITGILLRNREKSRYFRPFYARRMLRVFPLYFVLLPLILWLATQYAQGHYQWRRDALYDSFYLSNVENALHDWPSRFAAHLWSLSVEEQFYLVWPFFIFVAPPDWIVPLLASACAVLFGVRGYSSEYGSSVSVYNLFHLDGLLLGASLAAMDFRCDRMPKAIYQAALVAAVVLLFPPQISIGLDWQQWRGLQTISYGLIALAGAALIELTRRSEADSSLSRFFSAPLIVEFGKYSYAIYLVHYPLDSWIRANGLHPGVQGWGQPISPLPSVLYFVALSGLAYLVSQVTWHLLEKRCLALKKHFEYAQ